MDKSERHPHFRIGGEVKVSETENDWSERDPSTAIIEAIASIEGADPVGLAESWGTTLYDQVDPDALDKLVRNGHENSTAVTFTIGDYAVWIGGSELIVAATESNASLTD